MGQVKCISQHQNLGYTFQGRIQQHYINTLTTQKISTIKRNGILETKEETWEFLFEYHILQILTITFHYYSRCSQSFRA